ncbi:MAG: CBS domain-containing protein [Acidobacteriota bacterium]|nr:CBS domain-containing protein [Acidobacteriota bacterium]
MQRRIPFVKAVMTPFPYSIEAGARVEEARLLMHEHGIRHLPVVEREKLIGIVSDRDLRLVTEPSSGRVADEDLAIRDICERDVFVVELTERLDGVLDEMLRRRIGSAIVVKSERVVGIFTAVDACRFLRQLLTDFFPTDGSHVA